MANLPPASLGIGLLPLMVALSTCVAPSEAAQDRGRAAAPAATPAPPQRSATPPAIMVPAITLSRTVIEQGDLVRGTVTPAQSTLTMNGTPVTVSSNGHFLIGIDRDESGEVLLRATAPASFRIAPIERRFTIAARQWNIQNVNAPMRGGARSDAEFDRRRPAELAQMGAARRTVVDSDGWRQDFIWPVRGRISGVFGSQRVYQGVPGNFHNGVDVAVPTGTPFVAPADGVVILAATEPFTLEGYLLMIDHGMGLSSVFLHSSRLDVRTGDRVTQGQRLGAVGATGRATGPHMHWAMRWNGAKIDAQRFVGPM